MRTDGELLGFSPSIPEKWNGYRFRLVYRGSVIQVDVDRHAATFRIVSGGEVAVNVYGKKTAVTAKGVSVDLQEPA
jgi:maltose phosphorylase